MQTLSVHVCIPTCTNKCACTYCTISQCASHKQCIGMYMYTLHVRYMKKPLLIITTVPNVSHMLFRTVFSCREASCVYSELQCLPYLHNTVHTVLLIHTLHSYVSSICPMYTCMRYSPPHLWSTQLEASFLFDSTYLPLVHVSSNLQPSAKYNTVHKAQGGLKMKHKDSWILWNLRRFINHMRM